MLALCAPAGALALEARAPQPRDCAGALLGTPDRSTDRNGWQSPAQGFVTASLRGGVAGDWDLAAFRDGEPIGASTAFGSNERIDLWVENNERLVFQGCRRIAGPARAPLRITFQAFRDPVADNAPVQLVRVPISGPGDLERFERMGLDVTHDISPTTATLVLYSQRERTQLHALGYATTTVEDDLQAEDAADRAAERRSAKAGPSSLPSGRETYREYVDYTNDMKALAEGHPDVVREITIGNTLEGRPIQGLEIAGNVNETGDGRPAYVNMGVHHAREWPSGELPMEFAIDLATGYGTDPKITNLLDRARVFVIPIVNVDGFLASRSYGTSALDDDGNATAGFSVAGQAAYKRKNCRATVPAQAGLPCAMRTDSGVDLNRNYGAYWGGPGSSADVTSQSYRGTAPYSEPESAGRPRVLRPASIPPSSSPTTRSRKTASGCASRASTHPFLPQDAIGALTPDEAAMKELGDDMAAATGWTRPSGPTRRSAISPARPRIGTTSPRAPTAIRPKPAASTSTPITRTL